MKLGKHIETKGEFDVSVLIKLARKATREEVMIHWLNEGIQPVRELRNNINTLMNRFEFNVWIWEGS